MGESIIEAEAKVAKQRQKAQGHRGNEGGRGKKTLRATCPKGKRDEAKRATAIAAAAAGMSRRTYEAACTVVDSGDRELIDEMNRTRRVNGVARKLKKKQAVHRTGIRSGQCLPGLGSRHRADERLSCRESRSQGTCAPRNR